LLRAHAMGEILFRLTLDVIAQFLVEFLFDYAPPKQRTKAEAE